MFNIFDSLVTKRIVATVSALAVIAIGCAAGFWQLSRAHQKIAIAESLAARQKLPALSLNTQAWTLEEVFQRRVVARGHYIPGDSIWLDNRPRPVSKVGADNPAQSGFYVMTPLKLEGSGTVLWVNRGWAPRNNDERTQLPPVSTPDGVVLIEGMGLAGPGKVFELGKENGLLSNPRIEQNFDLAKESSLHGWQQLPFILQESGHDGADGLSRDWAPPTVGVDRHYAYAFQWFALAFSGFLFWLFSGLRQYRIGLIKREDKGE